MMKENVKSTYKSDDTEEWLDKVWTRPIGYLWARFFQKLNVHPNTVTILSMIIGASAALFFVHGSYKYEGGNGLLLNLAGVFLLAWANFYDSADGQLARMTGKKTRLGRILDGAASEVWFIPIYLSLVLRFYHHHSIEFGWLGLTDNQQNTIILTLVLFVLVLISGFKCHAGQCGLADYYRQIHLFFLKGKSGSELDNARQQQQIYDQTPWKGNYLWKAFLYTYVGYTRKQERQTPCFQQLMRHLKDQYGSAGNVPQEFRDAFRRRSLPLMPLTNILTFNTRAILLYLCCLFDLPWLYFFFEVILMSLLCEYMRRQHEGMCRELLSMRF